MAATNLFDINALSSRATGLSNQLKTARQGWGLGSSLPGGWVDEREPLLNEMQKTQAELGVAEQYQADLMGANAAANSRLNMGALASSRRRAGGSTFRRPRSSVTANDLAPNLGAANAKTLAETRRAKALADVSAQQAQRPSSNSLSSFTVSSTLGPRIWT